MCQKIRCNGELKNFASAQIILLSSLWSPKCLFDPRLSSNSSTQPAGGRRERRSQRSQRLGYSGEARERREGNSLTDTYEK